MRIRSRRTLIAAALCALFCALSAGAARAQLPNQSPVAVNDAYGFHGQLNIAAPGVLGNDSDPDGDNPLTVKPDAPCAIDAPSACLTLGGRGVSLGANGSVSFSPGNFNGTDSIKYKVCDSRGACSNSATITFNVTQSAPSAGAASYSFHRLLDIPAGGLLANASDPDGDPITIKADAPCAIDAPTSCLTHGGRGVSITPAGALRFNAGNFNGTDSINYKACDSLGACGTGVITFNVTQQAPVAGADSYNFSEQLTVPAPGILGNDSDPDGDQINARGFMCVVDSPNLCRTRRGNIVGIGDNGSLSWNSGNFVGTDVLDYQVCDDLGRCSAGTVTFKVSCKRCNCPDIPIVR